MKLPNDHSTISAAFGEILAADIEPRQMREETPEASDRIPGVHDHRSPVEQAKDSACKPFSTMAGKELSPIPIPRNDSVPWNDGSCSPIPVADSAERFSRSARNGRTEIWRS